MKGNGFRRLTAVEVSDSGTDDEFQPLNNKQRSYSFSCCKLCWCGTVAVALLALSVGAALGGYSLYGIQLEIGSLRQELDQLQRQHSAGYAELSQLLNQTTSDLQHLQSVVHELFTVMQAMRGGNSSALNSIHQRLGKVEGAVGVTFASNISQLSDKVKKLSAEMTSVVRSAHQAQNSSSACLVALGQHHRAQGDLKTDIYLLKRANKTLTMEVGQIRSDVRALDRSWSTANALLNSSLLTLQLAEDSREPCTNCCQCVQPPPGSPPELSSAPYTASSPATAGSTTPVLPTTLLPTAHSVTTNPSPEGSAYNFTHTSDVPTASSPTLQPNMEVSPTHTLQPNMEVSPTNTLQPNMEVYPTHTLQPNMEVSPTNTLQPNMETSPTNTLQPNMEVSPTHTLQPNMETSPTHTLQPNMEVSPTNTLQPNMEVSPTHTLHPSGEATPPGQRDYWRKLVTVLEGIRDNFNVSDSDSDGKLSKNEFQSLPQELAKVDKFFELCDINSDSFVDMDELHTVLTGIQHRLTAFPSPSPSPPTL